MDNKISVTAFLNKTLSILTAVFPIALSMCVCSGIGTLAGIILSCIFAVFYNDSKEDKKINIYLAFLIITYCCNAFGILTAIAAFVGCLVMLMILKTFKIKAKYIGNLSASAGRMLATALTVTVLFTTLYFGIGASGNNVREMIASYLSLGFHPNWRGVLYGTIVMVVMITFPRKFKEFSKTVSAPFIAVILTTALNFLLNPADMITSISEIGEPSFSQFKTIFILSKDTFSAINAILAAVALLFTISPLVYDNNTNKKNEKKSFGDILPNLTAAGLIAILCVLGNAFLARIPVHSCAVILIVGAWQTVQWGQFKYAFSNIYSVICFTAVIISILLFGVTHGIIVSAFISILLSLLSKKAITSF